MTYKYIWNVTSDNTCSFSQEGKVCNLTLTFIRVLTLIMNKEQQN
jgi:hypothetical protein